MEDAFNENEFKEFLWEFDDGPQYPNLPGDTLRQKMYELVTYCERHGECELLLTKLREHRPHIPWSQL
ncbi:MAG: hypothetical protein KC421_16885 [Anaerolineales bacterium]|nr:hypothetical protein [Anaerolineales bacterium]